METKSCWLRGIVSALSRKTPKQLQDKAHAAFPGEHGLVPSCCPAPLYWHTSRKKYAVTFAACAGRVIVNLLFFDSKPKLKGICILQFCCLLVLLMLLEMTYKESTAGSQENGEQGRDGAGKFVTHPKTSRIILSLKREPLKSTGTFHP